MRDLDGVFQLAEKYTSFDASPTREDVEGLYERGSDFFYVAEDESRKVVGFITGYERRGLPEGVLRSWGASRVGYIDLMAVDETQRRRGIGASLMKKLLEVFDTQEIDLIILDVPSTQEEAVNLYRKLGFQVRAYNMVKSLKEKLDVAGNG
jgi:ribosomal protein S18 acetylase RimI-like enzyme